MSFTIYINAHFNNVIVGLVFTSCSRVLNKCPAQIKDICVSSVKCCVGRYRLSHIGEKCVFI